MREITFMIKKNWHQLFTFSLLCVPKWLKFIMPKFYNIADYIWCIYGKREQVTDQFIKPRPKKCEYAVLLVKRTEQKMQMYARRHKILLLFYHCCYFSCCSFARIIPPWVPEPSCFTFCWYSILLLEIRKMNKYSEVSNKQSEASNFFYDVSNLKRFMAMHFILY